MFVSRSIEKTAIAIYDAVFDAGKHDSKNDEYYIDIGGVRFLAFCGMDTDYRGDEYFVYGAIWTEDWKISWRQTHIMNLSGDRDKMLRDLSYAKLFSHILEY